MVSPDGLASSVSMQLCKARILSGIHKIFLVKGTKLQDMLYAYCGSRNEARGCRRDDTFLGMIDETKALLAYIIASTFVCASIFVSGPCGDARILLLEGGIYILR